MSDYNADELQPPSWMNELFFTEVLKKTENNDSILITEVKITPATAVGDHYASVMFRAKIGYNTNKSKGNSKSVIIKTMPELDGHKKEFLAESFIFETEINMYSKTIPQFEAELRKIGDDTVLGVKALFHSLEPKKCIVLEDIVPKGYETIRYRSPNTVEVKAALLKLAKWHAVSYKLADEGDKSITEYREGFMNLKVVEMMPCMTTGMEYFIQKLETIAELKAYVPKLRILQKNILKRSFDSFNSYRNGAAEGVFVLSHGDFHAKNMMFKSNDKGEFEDVMLIDFQICSFAPAALDVIYGIYLLWNDDLRENHRDELIYYYASNFIETLKKMNFQGKYPKIADFYIDLIRHRHWEMLLLSTFLPLVIGLKKNSKMSTDDLIDSEDICKAMYDDPDYIEEVKRTLPALCYQGYID